MRALEAAEKQAKGLDALEAVARGLLDADLREGAAAAGQAYDVRLELRLQVQILRELRKAQHGTQEAPKEIGNAKGGTCPRHDAGGQAFTPAELGLGGAEQRAAFVPADDFVKVVGALLPANGLPVLGHDGHPAELSGEGNLMLLTPSCKMALATARRLAKAAGSEALCLEHLLSACEQQVAFMARLGQQPQLEDAGREAAVAQ